MHPTFPSRRAAAFASLALLACCCAPSVFSQVPVRLVAQAGRGLQPEDMVHRAAGIYLVEFDGTGPQALGRLVRIFRHLPELGSAPAMGTVMKTGRPGPPDSNQQTRQFIIMIGKRGSSWRGAIWPVIEGQVPRIEGSLEDFDHLVRLDDGYSKSSAQ